MRNVHVAVYDGLADWEIGYATTHINSGYWQRSPGSCRVVTVGESEAPVRTLGGATILPDTTLDRVTPAASAMLILPGAEQWLDGGLTAFAVKAEEFLEAGVPVAAVCGATAGLARHGQLDARAHTSNAPEFLASTGYGGAGRYQPGPVVVDGDLITGSGLAPVEFARAVLERLDLYEPSVLDAWYRLYGQRDPAAYAELIAA